MTFEDWYESLHPYDELRNENQYCPTVLKRVFNAGRKAGLLEAAEIAGGHLCEDCKSKGTVCEDAIAHAIRKAAEGESYE